MSKLKVSTRSRTPHLYKAFKTSKKRKEKGLTGPIPMPPSSLLPVPSRPSVRWRGRRPVLDRTRLQEPSSVSKTNRKIGTKRAHLRHVPQPTALLHIRRARFEFQWPTGLSCKITASSAKDERDKNGGRLTFPESVESYLKARDRHKAHRHIHMSARVNPMMVFRRWLLEGDLKGDCWKLQPQCRVDCEGPCSDEGRACASERASSH